MKIDEVIRKRRKELNLTQEQIATLLGVSAPAVNKWENGNSYPDITLLSPLARVLGIDINELLGFNENLSQQEVNMIIEEAAVEGSIFDSDRVIVGENKGIWEGARVRPVSEF